jgi:hypothetical protein
MERKELSKKIYDEYLFNGYDMTEDRLRSLVDVFEKLIKKCPNAIDVDIFFDRIREGYYGMLYKPPSDLVGKFNKFISEINSRPNYYNKL